MTLNSPINMRHSTSVQIDPDHNKRGFPSTAKTIFFETTSNIHYVVFLFHSFLVHTV